MFYVGLLILCFKTYFQYKSETFAYDGGWSPIGLLNTQNCQTSSDWMKM